MDWVATYREQSDGELLKIWRDRRDLVPHARAALESELDSRGLSPHAHPERHVIHPSPQRRAAARRKTLNALLRFILGVLFVFTIVAIAIALRHSKGTWIDSLLGSIMPTVFAILLWPQWFFPEEGNRTVRWLFVVLSAAVVWFAVPPLDRTGITVPWRRHYLVDMALYGAPSRPATLPLGEFLGVCVLLVVYGTLEWLRRRATKRAARHPEKPIEGRTASSS